MNNKDELYNFCMNIEEIMQKINNKQKLSQAELKTILEFWKEVKYTIAIN